jgi:hypothetical protein
VEDTLVHVRNVQQGDEILPSVWIRCTMPVVLRRIAKSPDVYRLQGGVYIPSVMKGEAFAQLQALGDSAEMATIE